MCKYLNMFVTKRIVLAYPLSLITRNRWHISTSEKNDWINWKRKWRKMVKKQFWWVCFNQLCRPKRRRKRGMSKNSRGQRNRLFTAASDETVRYRFSIVENYWTRSFWGNSTRAKNRHRTHLRDENSSKNGNARKGTGFFESNEWRYMTQI